MTKFPDLFAALAAPFHPDSVKVRAQTGRQFHYITARTAMNRLDNVLGPENWWDEYIPSENSVLCRLTIRLPSGEALTKCDAGGYAGMTDSGDDDKSGYSDAFKRAAVKFGVARYLYKDGVPDYGAAAPAERVDGKGDAYEGPDRSPEIGRPVADPRTARGDAAQDRRPATNGGGLPRTGRQLFAWAKRVGQEHERDVIGYINAWGNQHGNGERMIDWAPDQVKEAVEAVVRKLAAAAGSRGAR